MQRYQHDIRREVAWRGITKLYHFTPAANAQSILRNGLVSRDILLENDVDFFATDVMRLDDQLDAVSLSIHSINESMFDAKKRVSECEWLILEFDASILWTHTCRFCWKNAASSEIRQHNGFMGGPWAFAKMFEDLPIGLSNDRSYRRAFKRAACEPTDNAAEVQVFTPIEPDLIVDVTVRNQGVKNEVEALMHEVELVRPVVIHGEIF